MLHMQGPAKRRRVANLPIRLFCRSHTLFIHKTHIQRYAHVSVRTKATTSLTTASAHTHFRRGRQDAKTHSKMSNVWSRRQTDGGGVLHLYPEPRLLSVDNTFDKEAACSDISRSRPSLSLKSAILICIDSASLSSRRFACKKHERLNYVLLVGYVTSFLLRPRRAVAESDHL